MRVFSQGSDERAAEQGRKGTGIGHPPRHQAACSCTHGAGHQLAF